MLPIVSRKITSSITASTTTARYAGVSTLRFGEEFLSTAKKRRYDTPAYCFREESGGVREGPELGEGCFRPSGYAEELFLPERTVKTPIAETAANKDPVATSQTGRISGPNRMYPTEKINN